MEDDPSRRRHVIVLPRMLHPPKVEGMENGPNHSTPTTFMFFLIFYFFNI
ncbi:hypothetical protein Hanom_Chr09g00785571 [Helianthus anomalus]